MERFFEEHEENSREELKRAEHLILISLKYNRTCAVMKNGIVRLIAAYETSIDEYFEFLRRAGNINEVPVTIKERITLLKSLLGNTIAKYLRAYNKVVKVDKAQYCAVNEFRKGLMLKTTGKSPIEIDIKELEEQLNLATEFVLLLEAKMREND
jgi:hypothetical protein